MSNLIHLSSASSFRLRGSGSLALALTGPKPKAGTGVTLTDVEQQKVFQRVGTSAQVPVTGTCSGNPSIIQARAISIDTGLPVTSWTNVATNPVGGTFSGSLTVPQGGWYTMQVRDGIDHALQSNGSNKFGVGIVIGLIGQSNMNNFPQGVLNYPNGYHKVVEYEASTWRRIGNINDSYPPNTPFSTYGTFTNVGQRGDGYVYLGNLIAAATGVPVAFIERGVGGSDVASWMSGQVNWNAFASAVTDAGGGMEMALWLQGESDANLMSTATMKLRLADLHSQLKTLTGRGNTDFHFGVISIGPGSFNGSSEGEFGNMRAAHVEFATSTAGAFYVGAAHDTATTDGVHINGEGFSRLGRRWAKAAIARLSGGSAHCGPSISSTSRSGATITVTCSHTGGSALMDGAGGNGSSLTGFEVFDNGTPVTISSTVISGNTVILTLASTPAGTVTMSYAMQNAPHGTATSFVPAQALYDNDLYLNSSVGLPLAPHGLMTVT